MANTTTVPDELLAKKKIMLDFIQACQVCNWISSFTGAGHWLSLQTETAGLLARLLQTSRALLPIRARSVGCVPLPCDLFLLYPELSLEASCAILTQLDTAFLYLVSAGEGLNKLPNMASFQLEGIYRNSNGRKNACSLSSKHEMRNPVLEIFD